MVDDSRIVCRETPVRIAVLSAANVYCVLAVLLVLRVNEVGSFLDNGRKKMEK